MVPQAQNVRNTELHPLCFVTPDQSYDHCVAGLLVQQGSHWAQIDRLILMWRRLWKTEPNTRSLFLVLGSKFSFC